MAMNDAKVILITGAARGIGRVIARRLAERGYCVFGTARQPLQDELDGFKLLPLDVTSDESARGCVEAVLTRAGRLDVLINNAGVDLVGALEETSMADAQWVFDVNFWGAVRMVQTALPHMRARRSGQIINISSALGMAAWPFEGMYCASKYALEGYTEALCYELHMFGIKVSSVQPGFFKSEMAGAQRPPANPISDYEAIRERSIALQRQWAAHAPDPQPVAETVLRIIESERPRLRYPVGVEAHLAPPLAHLLPLSARFKLGRWMLEIDDWREDARRGVTIAALAAAAVLWLRRLRKRRR